MMLEITSKENDPHDFVIPYAQFHIGKAFFSRLRRTTIGSRSGKVIFNKKKFLRASV